MDKTYTTDETLNVDLDTGVEAPGTVYDNPAPSATDDGVPYAWIVVGETLVADQPVASLRAFQLHVGGKTFTHVSEGSEDRWVYRYDK